MLFYFLILPLYILCNLYTLRSFSWCAPAVTLRLYMYMHVWETSDNLESMRTYSQTSWSGVFPMLSVYSEEHPCISMRYFTTSRQQNLCIMHIKCWKFCLFTLSIMNSTCVSIGNFNVKYKCTLYIFRWQLAETEQGRSNLIIIVYRWIVQFT